jgi:hypothetical protein
MDALRALDALPSHGHRNWTTPINSFGIDKWRVNTMRQRQETGRLHGLTSLRVFVVCRRSY